MLGGNAARIIVMDDTALPPLSFAAIEARIASMPEGPISTLNTPAWATALNLIGAGGAILGLLPSVLVAVLSPQPWMAVMAMSGLAVMVVACAPPFVRSVWVLGRQFRHATAGFIEQMDHEREVFAELTRWLARYPKPVVADHLRFTQHMQASTQAKVGLLVGGLDKLGILPALGSAAILVKGAMYDHAPPVWLALVGIFLALLWGVAVLASFAQLRIRVFEALLAGAQRLQERTQS